MSVLTRYPVHLLIKPQTTSKNISKMTAENAPSGENAAFVNGNVATLSDQPNIKPKSTVEESLFTTIMLTIYDVILFLAVSIGCIIQVSIFFFSLVINTFYQFYESANEAWIFMLEFFLKLNAKP